MDRSRHTEKFMGLNQGSTSSFVWPEVLRTSRGADARHSRASRSTSPDPTVIWTQAFLLGFNVNEPGNHLQDRDP